METAEIQPPATLPLKTKTPLTEADLRLLRGRVRHWLRETIILMVDDAAAVKVDLGSMRPTDTQLKITCSSADIGKVIGKEGRNTRSLRIIALALSRANGHNFTVDVMDGREDIRGDRDPKPTPASN